MSERTLLPRTGSSLIAVALVLRQSCMPRRLMVPGGEADRGSRRGRRGPGRDAPVPSASSACIRVRSRTPGASSRAMGTLPLVGPWIIQRPGPRQAARPGERHGRADRLWFSSSACGRTWLPGASALCPGVTLSDTEGQENARGAAVLAQGSVVGTAVPCRTERPFCRTDKPMPGLGRGT